MAATLAWTKTSPKSYDSVCGRFQIRNVSLTTRAKWILFDTTRRDTCLPQYVWSESCVRLEAAQRKAERLAK